MIGRLPTYCHMLWDSVSIDQRGDVYTCCHGRPAILGNIEREPLAAIWSGSGALAMFRSQSRRGRLRCAPACNILSPEDKAGLDRPAVHREHPRTVRLTWGELCNIACIMCDQDHRSRTALDRSTLERNVDWARVEDCELQGGEILAMREARAFYLWLTNTRGTRTSLITNGLLVDDEWAEHLARGARWVQVSVNASTKATHELVNHGSKFERVLDGLGRLVDARRRLASDVAIVYKFTIVTANVHEIADAIGLAESLGCDEIAFGYDAPVPAYLVERPDLARALRQRLAGLLAAPRRIAVERTRLRYLGLLDDGRDTLTNVREVGPLPDPVSVAARLLRIW
jgi:MoaA/NifB/PqqE/SkfB family radical SAM enzyme